MPWEARSRRSVTGAPNLGQLWTGPRRGLEFHELMRAEEWQVAACQVGVPAVTRQTTMAL